VDNREAFGILQTELNAAIDESLARYSKVVQEGDVDGIEMEQERQRNLLNARNQLEVLRDLWPKLVGERKVAKKPKPVKKPRARRRKLKRGQKTPQEAYVVPILHALKELGGSGTVEQVLDRVGALMLGTLKEPDLELLPSGKQIRWRNTAQWARQWMVEEELLAGDSPRGTWEITEAGRAYLRQHAKNLTKLKKASRSTKAKLAGVPIEGLAVYARYKGRVYEAILFPDQRVRYGDEDYGSPTGAGLAATGAKSLNGWRFWRYVDDQGKEHYISDLRG
jgi:restriction system protein